MNTLKFILIIIKEHIQSILAARRAAAIERQQLYVEQLEEAAQNHPFADYVERHRREVIKLDRMQGV